MIDIVELIGGFLGIVAFFWRVRDEFKRYLHLTLEIEDNKQADFVTALATIENRGTGPKNLHYALLLIGPESEAPTKTAQEIADFAGKDVKISYTNDVEHIKVEEPVYTDNGRALIPLLFFYNEQVRIADETLTYKTLINTSTMKKGEPYSVRFFIFGKGKWRLHRSTQNLFVP